MTNLLQSSQVQASTAPEYYTNYLSNLAQSGAQAVDRARFIGPTASQRMAFQQARQGFGQFQPMITSGQQLLGQAGQQNIVGAGTPFLQAGTAVSGLSAMDPYAQRAGAFTGYEAGVTPIAAATGINVPGAAQGFLQAAAGQSPAELAAQYMNPFIETAAQSMSDIAQRNIRQNLAPQATAAAVGSGQFGSQRGAQVAGQIQAQAQQDLNSQMAQMLSQGYGQALSAAGQQQALLGQLGATAGGLTAQQMQNLIAAGTGLGGLQQGANQIAAQLAGTASQAQQAQNLANLQAAHTAGQLGSQQAAALQAAGLGMGTLGMQGSQMRLADLNALATLGAQQQTIQQNRQNFPLTQLQSLAGLLQGYSIPMTTTTQMEMSPFSALGALGTGALGLFGPMRDSAGNIFRDANGNPISLFNQIRGMFGGSTTPTTPTNPATPGGGGEMTEPLPGGNLPTEPAFPSEGGEMTEPLPGIDWPLPGGDSGNVDFGGGDYSSDDFWGWADGGAVDVDDTSEYPEPPTNVGGLSFVG